MSFDWSPEAQEMLIQLRNEGYSATRIAEEIGGGLNRNAVLGKAFRMRLPLVRSPRIVRHRRRIRKVVPSSEYRPPKVRKPLAPRPGLAVVVKQAPPEAPESKRLTIYQLTPNACRYIADESPPWTYCANDCLPGKSWCDFHAALCLQTVSVSEANRRAERAARYG